MDRASGSIPNATFNVFLATRQLLLAPRPLHSDRMIHSNSDSCIIDLPPSPLLGRVNIFISVVILVGHHAGIVCPLQIELSVHFHCAIRADPGITSLLASHVGGVGIPAFACDAVLIFIGGAFLLFVVHDIPIELIVTRLDSIIVVQFGLVHRAKESGLPPLQVHWR